MSGGVILLVEDNRYDEELTLFALETNNITNKVVVARDGMEAMDYLFGTGAYEGRDMNDMPKVVLLDLNLPKMHGLEVLRRIRSDEMTKAIPVIVLTSSEDDEDKIEGYSLGVTAYVSKPVSQVEFITAVRRLAAMGIF